MQEMSGYTEVRMRRRGCEGIHIAIWLSDSLFAFVGSWGSTLVFLKKQCFSPFCLDVGQLKDEKISHFFGQKKGNNCNIFIPNRAERNLAKERKRGSTKTAIDFFFSFPLLSNQLFL